MSSTEKPKEHLTQLQGLNFNLVLDRAPTTTYFSTDTTLPGMNIGAVSVPNPLVALSVPGDHIDFEPLELTFDVDSNLRNYKEIQQWMLELGFPQTFGQFKKTPRWNTSDGTLIILNSQLNRVGEFVFEGLWPTSLSSLMFSISNSDQVYIQAAVTFEYTLFRIND